MYGNERRYSADFVSWTLDIGKLGYGFYLTDSSYL